MIAPVFTLPSGIREVKLVWNLAHTGGVCCLKSLNVHVVCSGVSRFPMPGSQ